MPLFFLEFSIYFHIFSITSWGYKTHMLGNIKLVGGLLARGMLAAKVSDEATLGMGFCR